MTDERLEELVGGLLRGGVAISAATTLAGGVWYLAVNRTVEPHYAQFQAHVTGLRALGSLPAPLAVVLAGLLLLIATPVARVILTLVVFAIRRDRTYTWITLAVLAVLLYSLATALI